MISLITPTRFRIPQLLRYLKSFEETTRGFATESIIIADGDFETIDTAKATGSTILYRPIRQGAINCWNDGLRIAQGDVLIFGANDLIFHAGWLEEALNVLSTLTNKSGMVGFNDLSDWGKKNKLATHFLITRQCIIDVMGGCLAIPAYEHYFTDPEMNLRAQRAGCWAMADKAIVEHLSHYNGKAPDDECYAAARDSFARDQALYNKRKAAGFPNDFAAVIK
jgi:hypothetical protein